MNLREWLDSYTAQGDAAQRCSWVKRAWRVMRPLVEGYVAMIDIEGEPCPQTLINAIDASAREQRVGGKRWEQERAVLLKALDEETWPAPSADEIGVVSVAADLVEEQRYAEAISLLREQAPHAFSRKCPACSSPRGDRCMEIGLVFEPGTLPPQAAALVAVGEPKYPRARIVPHEARVL